MATTGPTDRLARVHAFARLLDTAFRIPGTNVRFGLDPLIGLVPGLGDILGVAASGYIIVEAARLGAPRAVLLRMLTNVAVEGLLGAVPLAGDVFDVAWRANERNARLLEQHVVAPEAARASSRRLVVGVTVAMVGLLAGLAAVVGIGVALMISLLV